MFKEVFSSFAVKDLKAAQDFYGGTLGLDVSEDNQMGLLNIELGGGKQIMIYPKDDHQAANYTILNLVAEDLDKTVKELAGQDIKFEKYPGFKHEDSGIVRGNGQGPDIAWFKDPYGNIIAVLAD